MEKLRSTIAEHARWTTLEDFIERIDTFKDADFSMALENAKGLLEAIGKQICAENGVQLLPTSKMNGILKNSFRALGYSNAGLVAQVSSALGTIGQHMGNLRNEIGITAHGKTLEEIRERNSRVDRFTRDFLIDSVEVVSCMMIAACENRSAVILGRKGQVSASADTDTEFDAYWNEIYGEMEMGEYAFEAARILNRVEPDLYLKERALYYQNKPKDDDGE